MPRFYVTTPIYYVNAPAHLGHAYTSIACDVLARWHRLRGDETFYLTGLDEHGGNIEKVAADAGVTPQAWCDRIAEEDRKFFAELGISNDDFIRTTEERHRRSTEAFWKKVAAGTAPDGKPNIYKGSYEGWYCARCEAYYAEGELLEGKCPVHGVDAEKLQEETYFFHLSGYQSTLDRIFAEEAPKPAGERLVVPEARFNEVVGILREGLRDISISRTKVKWGFPVPGDPAHVIYVWFDALINYLTGAGYPDTANPRWPFWDSVVHVMAKEIIRFHALLWPAMLLAAGVPIPRKVVVHGWWTVEGEKMSKSKGNVVDPRDYAREFGLDALRQYLLSEITFGADGDFSRRRFIERYNTDLANVFGNLAHRTVSMAHKYLGGKVKRPSTPSPWPADVAGKFIELVDRELAVPRFQEAIEGMWELFKSGNKFVDTQAPWNQEPGAREETLGHVLVLLEAGSWPLLAFLPESAAKLRKLLGLPADKRVPLPEVFNLGVPEPLFPRIDTKKSGK